MRFALINLCGASDEDMESMAFAGKDFADDVCDVWGLLPIEVQYFKGDAIAPPGWIPWVALKHPDLAGAAGYHATDITGRPYARAFLETVPDGRVLHDPTGRGESLAGVMMHELAETIADDQACYYAQADFSDPATDKRYNQVAKELSDPVQETAYPIRLSCGTLVDGANFIYPEWFNAKASGKVDHLGVLFKPLTIAPGGYAIVNEVTADGQVFAKKVYHHELLPAAWRDIGKRHISSRGNRRGVI